jgi:ankyrin repeat protein
MQPFNNNLQPIQNFTVSRSNSFPPLPNYQEPALSNHEYQNTQVPIPPDTQYLSNQEIHLSAMNGDKSSYMKKLVMKYGVDHSDHGGRTPLMYSVLGNQPKMTECLINMGAEIDAIDVSHHTALLWAVYHAKSEVVKVLLKHGANIQITDAQKRSVFHWAMKTPNVTCLKHLCKCTATFDMENKADTEGLTPLHWAVLCEQPQHIYTLLSSLPSAQISLPDPKDRTPLNYAVLNFSLGCIKAILDCCPMACNFKDTQGRTALHYACAENSDCVRTLLACKSCDIHAVDDLGTTPLHWAAASNQPSNLKLLLRRGADCDHKDNQDMTPLDHAYKRNHTECINLLEKLRLERSTSTWSITSQISIHPPNAPELDQFGHVPMRRPPSAHGHGLLSDDSSPLLANNDRLPADGNSNTEELEQQEVVVTNNNSNQCIYHLYCFYN